MAAAARTDVHCNLSIGTLDEEVWKATEPGTPHPRQRVEAVRRLNDAGIPTGVLVAPIIPGWSDRPEQLEEVTTACVDAGATSVTPIPLHLPPGVKEHFLGFLAEARPDLHRDLTRRYSRGAYLSAGEQHAIIGTRRCRPRARPSTPHAAPTPSGTPTRTEVSRPPPRLSPNRPSTHRRRTTPRSSRCSRAATWGVPVCEHDPMPATGDASAPGSSTSTA